MTRFVLRAVMGTVLSILAIAFVHATSIDTNIKNLKDKDPKVRAKAAYDLGCG